VENTPGVRELIETLPPADELPPLPTTGWEETTVLAAAMAAEPEAFVRGVMGSNLALAGRCANQAEVRGRLGGGFLDDLRWALVGRSRDPEADLRDRIACALSVGDLGDPRFERRAGPFGEYLLPPTADIPGAMYVIGENEPFGWLHDTWHDHIPAHTVDVPPFIIGRFAVTNVEWACFMGAGGYDDERWWDTAAGRAWRRGDGTRVRSREMVRYWVGRLRDNPQMIDDYFRAGAWDREACERWRRRVEMSAPDLQEHIDKTFPDVRLAAPEHWGDHRLNRPSQPVVGVCWFEARAYCRWLAAQSGVPFRLPTEVEWEAAARGAEGRAFAYGPEFDALRANVVDTRLHRSTPVGVFPNGDTPEGVSDMSGNVWQWTSSAREHKGTPPADFRYPYDAHDGREDPEIGTDDRRVLRGGSWGDGRSNARAADRNHDSPVLRNAMTGFRLAAGPTHASS